MAGFLVERFSAEQAHDLLNEMAEIIGKPESQFDGEIEGILEYCVNKRNAGSIGIEKPRPYCTKDRALITSILQTYQTLFDQTTKSSASDAILKLFQANELICYGRDLYNPLTATPIKLASYAEDMQYIVPNPITDAEGVQTEKGLSVRCKANINFRKYLIVEFDDPELPKTDQAILLSALDRIMPLVLVVDSGGKSLHGWFDVKLSEESETRKFFKLATKLGADPNLWSECAWVRMPGGKRCSGGIQMADQRILFLKEGSS